jgi:hypothetical protein
MGVGYVLSCHGGERVCARGAACQRHWGGCVRHGLGRRDWHAEAVLVSIRWGPTHALLSASLQGAWSRCTPSCAAPCQGLITGALKTLCARLTPCTHPPPFLAGGTVALYAQLCRTMGFSPFGTLRLQDHQQVLAMKSGEAAVGSRGASDPAVPTLALGPKFLGSASAHDGERCGCWLPSGHCPICDPLALWPCIPR